MSMPSTWPRSGARTPSTTWVSEPSSSIESISWLASYPETKPSTTSSGPWQTKPAWMPCQTTVGARAAVIASTSLRLRASNQAQRYSMRRRFMMRFSLVGNRSAVRPVGRRSRAAAQAGRRGARAESSCLPAGAGKQDSRRGSFGALASTRHAFDRTDCCCELQGPTFLRCWAHRQREGAARRRRRGAHPTKTRAIPRWDRWPLSQRS